MEDFFENKNYEKYFLIILFVVLIILYFLGFYYLYSKINIEDDDLNSFEDKIISTIEDNIEIPDNIYVDIKGSIKKPGVYVLDKGSRVNDLIVLAGGLNKDANTRFINLSKVLNDGDVIVIYSNKEIEEAKKKEIIEVEVPCVCEEVRNDGCYIEDKDDDVIENTNKININTASVNELLSLYGIGEAKAKSIIEYRNQNGNFNKIEDILNVSGISENVFEKIKEDITV